MGSNPKLLSRTVFSSAKGMVLSSQPDAPIFPPSDLLSDEPPLETDRHLKQLVLLLTCIERLWRDRQDFYAGGNMSIYYSIHQRKSEDVRGPDFFVVLDTERKERKSWVVWAESGKYPNVIVELLSDTTASVDRGLKKELYQDIFRTPEYFWFHPYTLEFKGFRLNRHYEDIEPNQQGWLWSQELQLYLGVAGENLRFFTAEGELVARPDEAELQAQQRADAEQQRADAEQQRADAEQQRAEQAEARAELLARRLQELGIGPEGL